MLLEVFDKEMNQVGVVELFDTLIWTRRYSTCGEFSLLVPCTPLHSSLLREGNIIMKDDEDDEAGQIEYCHTTFKENGEEMLEVEGRFLTWWIGKRVLQRQLVAVDSAQAVITQLVTETITNPANAKLKIPSISIAEMGDLGSPVIDFSGEAGTNVREACESVARAAGLGFKLCTDRDTGRHSFMVYAGRDLTDGNGLYDPCIFSFELENMREQEYEYSKENYRSTAYVVAEMEDGAPKTMVIVGDDAEGIDRDEIWIDASNIKQTYEENGVKITLTQQEFTNLLIQRGEEELSKHREIVSLINKVTPSGNIVYKQDYDVGDIVTCVNERWGVRADVRISEVQETYTEKGQEIDIQFGESITTYLAQIAKTGR